MTNTPIAIPTPRVAIISGRYDGEIGTLMSTTAGWSLVELDDGTQIKLRQAAFEVEEGAEAEQDGDEPAEADDSASDTLELDDGDEEAEPADSKSIVPERYRATYTKTKLDKGVTVLDNNDSVAQMLRGLELDETYKMTAALLECTENSLRLKYEHLNLGQQRMNLGNLVRGFYKRVAARAAAAVETEQAAKYIA